MTPTIAVTASNSRKNLHFMSFPIVRWIATPPISVHRKVIVRCKGFCGRLPATGFEPSQHTSLGTVIPLPIKSPCGRLTRVGTTTPMQFLPLTEIQPTADQLDEQSSALQERRVCRDVCQT